MQTRRLTATHHEEDQRNVMPQHHSSEQWHKLPAAVTALILQHVPLQGTLAAARVCQTWAEAAALATSSIKLRPLAAPKLPGLRSWLQQHGQQLTNLEVDVKGADKPVLELPDLRQLCSLMLVGCKLRLLSAAHMQRMRSAGHSLVLLPHLTSLQLGGFVLSTPSTLLQLTRVTSLRSLQLGERFAGSGAIQITPKLQQQPKKVSQALTEVLQHHTQLTQLTVWGLVLEDSALGAVTGLQQLQDCCVSICESCIPGHYSGSESSGYTSPDLLSVLPPSLTALTVQEGRARYDPDPTHISLPRQLPQLAALRRLNLDNAQFFPSALAGKTKLQRLSLCCCSLLGDGGVDPDAHQEDGGYHSSQGVAAFLAAVGQMQQLQVLEVEASWEHENLNRSDVPLQAYSALTASTRLQSLKFYVENDAPVPPGAVQHMFPAGRQLPHLTYILMQGMDRDAEYMEKPCMTAAELAGLVSCCPALRALQICNALEASADVSPLLQLPSCCTSIHVGGPAFGDTAAGVVCQLSQLRDLTWYYSEGLTDRGVEKLTVLTRLQELYMWQNLELSDCIINTDEDDEDTLHLSAKAKGVPPVWQQLRQLCDQSPVCAPARLQEVSRELQRLQAEVGALRQRNTQLQEENRELQQLRSEVVALRQCNTHLEQQLAQLQGQRQGTRRGRRMG